LVEVVERERRRIKSQQYRWRNGVLVQEEESCRERSKEACISTGLKIAMGTPSSLISITEMQIGEKYSM
jgi:hypothetical protein